MTAIIASEGLELLNASHNLLSSSAFAGGALGLSAVGVSFNIATGNAAVWGVDYSDEKQD